MSGGRLPSTAIWELVRSLSAKEAEQIREKVVGTRLEWLFDTLRETKSYSEEVLRQHFMDDNQRLQEMGDFAQGQVLFRRGKSPLISQKQSR